MASFNDLLMQVNQIGDVQAWLTNKFGDGTESWSDKVSILSQLNKEVLREIRGVFNTLHINVKLKFLLYILHVPRRVLDDNKHEFDAIVTDSLSSTDPWVQEIANLVKSFRADGSISFDSPRFCELVSDIKKIVKKQGDKGILPYEAMFMNKTAFQTTFGHLPPLEKHFTLAKRAKSASLRQELLQKAHDLANGKRSNPSASAAIRCRGISSSFPMKGIPSRSAYEKRSAFGSSGGASGFGSGFGVKPSLMDRQNSMNKFSRYPSGPAGKREGGIVLLDSFEAPPMEFKKGRKTITKADSKTDAKKSKDSAGEADKEKDKADKEKTEKMDDKTPEKRVVKPGDDQQQMASEAAAAVDSISPIVAHKSFASSDNEPKAPEKRPPLLPASLESVVSQTATKSTPDYAAGLLATQSRFGSTSGVDPTKSHPQSTLSTLLTAPPVSDGGSSGPHNYLASSSGLVGQQQQQQKNANDSISGHQQQQQPQQNPLFGGPPAGNAVNSQPTLAVKARGNMYSRYQTQKSIPTPPTSGPLTPGLPVTPTAAAVNNNNNEPPKNPFVNPFGAQQPPQPPSQQQQQPNFGPRGTAPITPPTPAGPAATPTFDAQQQAQQRQQQLAQQQAQLRQQQQLQQQQAQQQQQSNIYRPMLPQQTPPGGQQQQPLPGVHQLQHQMQQQQQLQQQLAHQQQQQQAHLQHSQQQQQMLRPPTSHQQPPPQQPPFQQNLQGPRHILQQNPQQQQLPPHLLSPNGGIRHQNILQSMQQQQQASQRPPNPYGMYGLPPPQQQQQQRSEPEVQRHPQPPPPGMNPYGVMRIMNEASAAELTSDIWNKSNYLCNDERNLILNFLKGTLDNPIPNCGNSAMLKYYEQIEVTQITPTAPSVSVHIEMYFLMNFDTREWKKFRSVKPVVRDLQINNDRNINKIRFILPPPAEQMSNNWHLFEAGVGMPLQIERPPPYGLHPGQPLGPGYRTLGNSH